jgi:hypothetical protein
MERRLIDYLPPFVQNFKEMSAIMETEQPEFELAWQNAENTLADQFVTTATINGVKRWEKIYEIEPKATDTLDERRFVILTKMNEQPPYNMEALKNTLNALCGEDGYALLMNYSDYELTVKLALSNEHNFDAVIKLLARILPANILSRVSMYNTHEMLSKFTHEQLAQFTHDEIRKNILA